MQFTKKNEEADKLIEIVGIETEKVSKEKILADEDELKVNKINIYLVECVHANLLLVFHNEDRIS